MERAIDRTSYRRSARVDSKVSDKSIEVDIKSNKRFSLMNLLMNQIIVSMLIIIGILTAKYFDVNEVTDWISENMSNGYTAREIVNKFSNLFSLVESGEKSGDTSGDKFLINDSGENSNVENNNSGEFLSAVEGINQMIEDARIIKETYQLGIPLRGTITSTFGSRVSDNPIVSSYHTGLDIAANTGTDICAAHSGKVIMSEVYSSYGNCIMIENEKIVTVYAHCSELNVKKGQLVNKGDIIAKVGMTGNATGPHLHFEIRYEGRFIDPQKILNEK